MCFVLVKKLARGSSRVATILNASTRPPVTGFNVMGYHFWLLIDWCRVNRPYPECMILIWYDICTWGLKLLSEKEELVCLILQVIVVITCVLARCRIFLRESDSSPVLSFLPFVLVQMPIWQREDTTFGTSRANCHPILLLMRNLFFYYTLKEKEMISLRYYSLALCLYEEIPLTARAIRLSVHHKLQGVGEQVLQIRSEVQVLSYRGPQKCSDFFLKGQTCSYLPCSSLTYKGLKTSP